LSFGRLDRVHVAVLRGQLCAGILETAFCFRFASSEWGVFVVQKPPAHDCGVVMPIVGVCGFRVWSWFAVSVSGFRVSRK